MMDRRNSVRETVENGNVTFGAKAATYSPAIIEVYGQLGLDWVWIDFEHAGPTPWDSSTLDDLVRAAEVGGTELLVRPPKIDASLIRKVLDTGVRNLIFPRVDTAEEVRQAVEATRFEYEGGPGERGLGDWRSSGYGIAHHSEYVRDEDDNVFVGVIVEKRAAVENIDEILSVPKLDFVWIGINDLCVQLNHPGDPDHPDVVDAIETIERAARDAKVPLAGVANDTELTIEYLKRDYQLVRIGGELSAVRQVLTKRLSDLSQMNIQSVDE